MNIDRAKSPIINIIYCMEQGKKDVKFMKLDFKTNVVVVGKDRGEYQGKPTYKISVAQNGDAGTMRCNDLVYNFFEKHDMYKPYNLSCTLNDKYGTVTVFDISEGVAGK